MLNPIVEPEWFERWPFFLLMFTATTALMPYVAMTSRVRLALVPLLALWLLTGGWIIQSLRWVARERDRAKIRNRRVIL